MQMGSVVPANPPPAATIVLNGTRTERERELETELERERREKREREMRLAQLEDENRRLKTIPTTPAPKKSDSNWTFFEED